MDEETSIRMGRLRSVAGRPGGETTLLASMCDESAAVRDAAVALAARHMSPGSLANLLYQRESPVLTASAIAALERQGPAALPHLLTLARGSDARVAMFATRILARSGDPAAGGYLVPLLRHTDQNVVVAAVEALGRLRAREAVAELLPLLRGEMWLQLATISALGDLGDARAVGPLVAFLDHELLASPAIEALGKIADREALLPLLAHFAEVERLPQRDRALRAIGEIIDRHQPGPAAFLRLRRALAEDRRLGAYLQEALVCTDVTLGRAATRLILGARLRGFYAAAFARAQAENDTSWMAVQGTRFGVALRAAVIALLAHPDPQVRQGVLRSCWFQVDAVALLTERLHDEHMGVRVAACAALERLSAPAASAPLIQLVLEGSSEEQQAAAAALRLMPGADLGALERCLRREATVVQQLLALSILEARRASGFVSRVLELAASDRPALRAAALRAFAANPDVDAEARLLVGLHDSSEEVCVEAMDLLVGLGHASAVPHLVRLLEPGSSLRYHAIRALGRLADESAVAVLIARFAGATAHERTEIVVALARIGGQRVLPFLRERTGDPSADVRRAAAEGLARHAGETDVATIAELARDDDWVIRNHAAWALGRLGVPAAEEPLLALSLDIEVVVARTARAALSKLRTMAAAVP